MKTPEQYLDEVAKGRGHKSIFHAYAGTSTLLHEITQEAMRRYAEDAKPKWISVNDELPEDLKDVLYLRIYDAQPSIGYFAHGKWHGGLNPDGEIKGNGYWESEIDESQPYMKVTHWMPLPEPPKRPVTD